MNHRPHGALRARVPGASLGCVRRRHRSRKRRSRDRRRRSIAIRRR
jgi:hypothetical protein